VEHDAPDGTRLRQPDDLGLRAADLPGRPARISLLEDLGVHIGILDSGIRRGDREAPALFPLLRNLLTNELAEGAAAPLLGLELPGPGLTRRGHADRQPVLLQLVDAQDALAAVLAAVGDHVDGLGIARRVELDPRPGERLAVALPDHVILLDGPRDRADDLLRRLLAVVARHRRPPGTLVTLQFLPGGFLVGHSRAERPRHQHDQDGRTRWHGWRDPGSWARPRMACRPGIDPAEISTTDHTKDTDRTIAWSEDFNHGLHGSHG